MAGAENGCGSGSDKSGTGRAKQNLLDAGINILDQVAIYN